MDDDTILIVAVLGVAALYLYKTQTATTPTGYSTGANYNPVANNGGYPVNSNPVNSYPDYQGANNPPSDVSGQYAAGGSGDYSTPPTDSGSGDYLPGSGGYIDPITGQPLDITVGQG